MVPPAKDVASYLRYVTIRRTAHDSPSAELHIQREASYDASYADIEIGKLEANETLYEINNLLSSR